MLNSIAKTFIVVYTFFAEAMFVAFFIIVRCGFIDQIIVPDFVDNCIGYGV